MKLLTIGQMAKLNHISEQTLRLYDRMGLLSPAGRGKENGYRYYDVRQNARLDMIQYMKSLGMRLQEIKAQLDGGNIPYLKGILEGRKRDITAEMDRLQLQQRAIDRTLEGFRRYENAPPDGTILVEYIEKRRIYCIDSGVNFYDYGLDTYEMILRELKESLYADRLPETYFCNAGTILRLENLLRRRFYSTEVFVLVDEGVAGDRRISEIPAGNYLCIYCDRFQKEREYAGRLLEYAEGQGLRLAGDYVCEVIAELSILEESERGMFLRLQIPIYFHKQALTL